MEGTVKVSGLSKSFKSSGFLTGRGRVVPVLRQIDFSLESGELAAVVGESGSGKTTLGRCLMGLLPFEEGEVTVNGFDVGRLGGNDEKKFRMKAQMVFQNPYSSLNPAFRAREAVLEAIRVHNGNISRADAENEVERLAAMVQLPVERLMEFPPQLSGGEKRRVVFARSLATSPSFVVTDEPLSGLDQPIQAQLLEILKKIHERQKTTMLFISHDLKLVRFLATRVIVMHRGRIVEDSPSEVFFGRSSHHPFSEELLASAFEQEVLTGADNPVKPPERGPEGCSFRHRCPLRLAGPDSPCDKATPMLVNVESNHRIACHRFS